MPARRKSEQKSFEEASVDLKKRTADLDGFPDPMAVDNPRPGMRYYWAAKDPTHPQSVRKMKYKGYEVVNAENNHGEVAPFAEEPDAENGPIQHEDSVLMCIPEADFVARRHRVSALGHERVEAAREQGRDAVRKYGQDVQLQDDSSSNRGRKIFFMGG